jgi:hypothetical protein
VLGPLLFICGTGGGFLFECVKTWGGKRLEWDGGEAPVGGEAIRGKDTERGGAGILKFYTDVHRTKKNSERYRIIYTTDGTTFKHVDGFGEVPAGPGDRLFMDTLPPQHTDGAIELLRKGVEVY